MTINIIILLKLLCCTSNSTFAPQIWRGDDGGADHITLSELRSKCSIWGAALSMSNTISLMVSDHCLLDFITISYLLLISDICSSILTFGPACQKWPILTTKKVNMRAEKKRLPQGRYWHVLFAKNGVQIDQIWPVWLHLYFTSGYRGFPPCTLSQHPDNRETGYSNVLGQPTQIIPRLDMDISAILPRHEVSAPCSGLLSFLTE